MFETSITVAGKVISDITQRVTTGGHRMCQFRVMSQERRFHRDSGEWVDGDRLFVRVTCWRRLAEGVASSLAKGDQVVVTGRFHIDQYTTADGERRMSAEVEANAVGPDLSRCSVLVNRQVADAAAAHRTDQEVPAAA